QADPRRPALSPPAPVQGDPGSLAGKGPPQADGAAPGGGPSLPPAALEPPAAPDDLLGALDLRRRRGLPQGPDPQARRPEGDPEAPPRPPRGRPPRRIHLLRRPRRRLPPGDARRPQGRPPG